jgi:hypothetical protein
MIDLMEARFPDISDLIFYPENNDVTPEQILEQAKKLHES